MVFYNSTVVACTAVLSRCSRLTSIIAIYLLIYLLTYSLQ